MTFYMGGSKAVALANIGDGEDIYNDVKVMRTSEIGEAIALLWLATVANIRGAEGCI